MFGDKIKKIFENTDNSEDALEKDETRKNNKNLALGNDKKKIENLVFFVVILIITIIAINLILNGNKETNKQENNLDNKKLATVTKTSNNSNELNTNIQGDLETKLENILSKIEGVGEVKVCVNYSQSSELIAMYNENSRTSTTEETDTSGGNRKIEETDIQKDIIYEENDGQKTPITQKIIQPKLEGAIITAKGANNLTTKTNIIQAVEAATGLATHKIQVFQMN